MTRHLRFWHAAACVVAVPLFLLLGGLSPVFYAVAAVAAVVAGATLLVVQRREQLEWLSAEDRPPDFHGHYGPLQ